MTLGSALRLAALVALWSALAATGAWLLFSQFAAFDDEGYILFAARASFLHGGLYDQVYSQYGPAFHLAADLFQRLSGPLDHNTARGLTLGLWMGAATACAGIAFRHSRSIPLAGVTLTGVFFILYFFVDEPFHPGALIVFLLAGSVWLLDGLDGSRPVTAAAVTGALLALLILSKINVGVFYGLALGAWAALSGSAIRRGLIATALIAFSIVLFRPLLTQPWVQLYALHFAVAALTLLAVATPPTVRRTQWLAAGAALGATGAGVAVVLLLRGTSLSGLLEGVLLGPLRHPATYSYPVDWRPGSVGLAVLSPLLLLVHSWISRRSIAAADRLIVALRLIQAAALLLALLASMHLRVIGAVFSYVAPLIWTWVVPLSAARNAGARSARTLLALVLLLQFLHAFPIGGSQESWGIFLFIPLVALGLDELRRATAFPIVGRAAACSALVLVAGKVIAEAHAAHARYASRAELGLPGGALHLPDASRTAYRILAENAVVHGDMLFSLPGLLSFNLWTGLPPPTGRNTTLWFSLLSAADQQAIIRALDRTPGAVLIRQDDLLAMMAANGVRAGGPVVDFLHEHFQVVFRLEGFSFLIRSGRSVAPLDVARLAEPQTIVFNAAFNGPPIARIVLRDLDHPDSPPLVLDAQNTQASVARTNRAGALEHPPASTRWPLRLHGLNRLELRCAALPPGFALRRLLLCGEDTAGHRTVEARFSD